MKRLRFKSELKRPILAGTKTMTWRIDDEKDLRIDDVIELIDSATDQPFAHATITEVKEQTFRNLWTQGDGHETYANPEGMLAWFSEVYQKPMTLDTRVKVVRFQIQ